MAAIESVTLEVADPAAADASYAAALVGAATTLRPAKHGSWGHGGVSLEGFEWESR